MGDYLNDASILESFDYNDLGTIDLNNATGSQDSNLGLREAYTSPHIARNRQTQQN